MSRTRTIRKRLLRVAGAVGIVVGVMLPAAALAQEGPVYPTPSNPPEVTDPSATGGSGTSQTQTVVVADDTLPVTGGQIAGLALIGLGITGAGVAMVRIGRRSARVV